MADGPPIDSPDDEWADEWADDDLTDEERDEVIALFDDWDPPRHV